MGYLILHFDVEFIVGTISDSNGTLYPINNKDRDNLFWLYFFNNPHDNKITFGKENRTHFNDLKLNYYGNFFDKVEQNVETFHLRSIERPIIDLMKESGLVDNFKKSYRDVNHDENANVPTLITFSSSISDISKQKTVEYLKENGFQIDSYTIPLAELVSYYQLSKKGIKFTDGSNAVFLEATNSTLHLMQMTFSDDYFLKDSELSSWIGRGIDPRKRAITRFVVNEVNKATGILSSEIEKENECIRLESKSDNWLKRLDALTINLPLRISSVSFASAPGIAKEVLVRKEDLNSDLGYYTQDLKDIYANFKLENIGGDVDAVFLLGDCFQNERVKHSFEQIIDKNNLYFYKNSDLQGVLSIYPKIDFNRYLSEESRIAERAKAEEKKQVQQRAFEDRQKREAEEEVKERERLFKIEKDKKTARKLYDKALDCQKKAELYDAKVNVENALILDKHNKEFKNLLEEITIKIEELETKNKLYKEFLNKGDKFLKNSEFEYSLKEYEAAKVIFNNEEIIKKIINVKFSIKKEKENKKQILKIITQVESLIISNELHSAKEKAKEILNLDSSNKEANTYIEEINKLIEDQERQKREKISNLFTRVDSLIRSKEFLSAQKKVKEILILDSSNREANIYIAKIDILISNEERYKREKILELNAQIKFLIKNNDLSEALKKTKEILVLDSANGEAKLYIEKIEKLKVEDSRQKREKISILFAQADSLIKGNDLLTAQEKIREILNLDSANKEANAYIAEINKSLEEEKKKKQKLKDRLSELLLYATLAENKKEFDKALEKLKEAQIIDAESEEIKKRIKKVELDLSFHSVKSSPSKLKGKDNDFLNPAHPISEREDLFISKSKSNQIKRTSKNGNDDFLNKEKSKNKKNNFLTYNDNKNKSASKTADDNFLNPTNK